MIRTFYAVGSVTGGATKVLSDDGTERMVIVRVISVGHSVFLGHSALELLNGVIGQAGYQVKDTSTPTDGRIPWKGDLWVVADVDNVQADIEVLQK